MEINERESMDRETYAEQIRRTFQAMSDQALDFQDARIPMNDCTDRREIDREINRRAHGGTRRNWTYVSGNWTYAA
jgi:hypothetical protein